MLKYEIFPTKRFPKKTRKKKRRGERERRLIDATVFYVHGKNGAEIDFHELRNRRGRQGEEGSRGRWGLGLGARLRVSPGGHGPFPPGALALNGEDNLHGHKDTPEPAAGPALPGPSEVHGGCGAWWGLEAWRDSLQDSGPVGRGGPGRRGGGWGEFPMRNSWMGMEPWAVPAAQPTALSPPGSPRPPPSPPAGSRCS